MATIKLTKNEQKVQKDNLKQFQRYLPTLQLKKQQLQSVIMKENAELEQMLESGDLDAFVEKRARDEDLGYAYPDERVYYDMSAQD